MPSGYSPALGGPSAEPTPAGSSNSSGRSDSNRRPWGMSAPVGSEMIRVGAVEILSAHARRMTDKGYHVIDGEELDPSVDYGAGGNAFGGQWYGFDPTWVSEHWISDSTITRSYPVSHTGGEKVKLLVFVNNTYSVSKRARVVGTVLGDEAAEDMVFDSGEREFASGWNFFEVTSKQKLKQTVQSTRFRVQWLVDIGGFPSFHVTSDSELLMTMGEPKFKGDELTYARIKHAVDVLQGDWTDDLHAKVKSLMSRLATRFTGKGHSKGPFFLFRNQGSHADCLTLSLYADTLLSLIGIPGTHEAVELYVEPVSGEFTYERTKGKFPLLRLLTGKARLHPPLTNKFRAIESPASAEGMHQPKFYHPTNSDWYLALLDSNDYENRYEGCLKYSPKPNNTLYYPVPSQSSGYSKKHKVISDFFTLRWLHPSGSEKIKDVTIEEGGRRG